MRSGLRVRPRHRPRPRVRPRCRAAAVVCLGAVVLAGVLSPAAAALPPPLPATGAEGLLTEGVTVEGPLVNNLTLPAPK